jgi:hypothetical protein
MFFSVARAHQRKLRNDDQGGGVNCCGVTRTVVLLLGVSGLIAVFWFLYEGEALRFLVSFI